ncbi:MAG: NADH-quinone oxidoreductase subunit J [Actinomycetota bacterium]|nr:NADH-quinone oxidoreductase subunit J [Actinomycetota bacterium]
MDLVVFWLVAPISVAAAVLMLVQRNAVYSALFLIVNQFTLAVLFVLLGAHFLAAVQVIVYAGAIMVLFLFVIMFLGVDRREALIEPIRAQRPMAFLLGLLLIAEVVFSVRLGIGLLSSGPLPPPQGSVQQVAGPLFTRYVFPFEVTSVLLIVAAIAAMVMARRRGRGLPPAAEGEDVAEPAAAQGSVG